MPTPVRRREREREAVIREILEAQKAFDDPSEWKASKSKPDNVWRDWGDVRLCVFRRGRWWAWSIADSDDVCFSPVVYGKRSEAKQALAQEMGLYDV